MILEVIQLPFRGLDALVKKPMTPPIPDNWDGPYIEKIPLDPWGSPYQYVSPGRYKGSYDLWSMGKDGASFTDENDIRIYIIGGNIDLSEKVKGAIGVSPILITLKDKILNSIDLALLGGALMAQRKGSVTLPLRARPRRVKKDKSLFKLTSIVAILICFFIFSKVFFNQRISYLNLKETELAQLEAKAGEVDEIKREYMDVKDKLTAIDGFLYKSTLYTRLLEELNSTLPQGTTVEVIYMEEGEIREMRGSTLSTSALISALEHSKYFLYPKLSAPISKGREGLEEFRISVRFSLEGDKG